MGIILKQRGGVPGAIAPEDIHDALSGAPGTRLDGRYHYPGMAVDAWQAKGQEGKHGYRGSYRFPEIGEAEPGKGRVPEREAEGASRLPRKSQILAL